MSISFYDRPNSVTYYGIICRQSDCIRTYIHNLTSRDDGLVGFFIDNSYFCKTLTSVLSKRPAEFVFPWHQVTDSCLVSVGIVNHCRRTYRIHHAPLSRSSNQSGHRSSSNHYFAIAHSIFECRSRYRQLIVANGHLIGGATSNCCVHMLHRPTESSITTTDITYNRIVR